MWVDDMVDDSVIMYDTRKSLQHIVRILYIYPVKTSHSRMMMIFFENDDDEEEKKVIKLKGARGGNTSIYNYNIPNIR